MAPRIVTGDLCLAGVQGVIDHDRDVGPQLQRLWARVVARLDDIPDQTDPPIAVGYWQFVDHSTRVYFAGVRVASLARFRWDHAYGLAGWRPGPTTVAVFEEPNGQEGTVVPGAFGAIDRQGYAFDGRFLGEFEVCPLEWMIAGSKPPGENHEIWLPVVPTESRLCHP